MRIKTIGLLFFLCFFLENFVTQACSLNRNGEDSWRFLENSGETISVSKLNTDGEAVLVGYAGWRTPDQMARKWVAGVVEQSPFKRVFSRIYAVQGPKDVCYQLEFIKNEVLAKDRDVNLAKIVYIIAHSSGSYVADEFLSYASAELLKKIRLVILDGAKIAIDHRNSVKHKYVSAIKHLDKPREVDGALSSTLVSWNYPLWKEYYGANFISLDADLSACQTEQDIHMYLVSLEAGKPGLGSYAGPKFNIEATFPREFADELQKMLPKTGSLSKF